jgi:hypothetical protein
LKPLTLPDRSFRGQKEKEDGGKIEDKRRFNEEKLITRGGVESDRAVTSKLPEDSGSNPVTLCLDLGSC